jgi:hypothetical protein
VDGWSVADDEWADDIGGIPCPDWTKVFGFTADRELFCVPRWIFPLAMFRVLELLTA